MRGRGIFALRARGDGVLRYRIADAMIDLIHSSYGRE